MLAVGRVLLVLLAGIPVCRGGSGANVASYSSYYDADGDAENADFYDSYNDEIKQPPARTTVMEAHTRLKRNDLEDIRTLNPGEIIDVKGALNNILQGKKRDTSREQPARDYTDTYEYIENSNNVRPEDRTAIASEFKKWLPTVEGQRWSPAVDKQETMVGSSSEVTEQHWSFVYQPETSTYSTNDIIAEVRRMMPEGVVPKRSSTDLQNLKPKQEVQTFGTTENTDETENTIDIYPQETSTYSNSFMQAEVSKLVENWSPETKVIDLYPQETSTYSNSEMQAEVKKLVQHWSPNNKQESTYNDAAMRAEVRSLVQHWSSSTGVKSPSHTSIVQHWNPAMSKTANSEIHQQKSGIQSGLGTWGRGRPMSDLKHRNPSDNAQQWIPSDIVQQRDQFHNLQHRLPSEKDLVKIPAVKGEQQPAVKVQYWSRTSNAEQRNTLAATDEDTTLDTNEFTGFMREGEEDNPKVPPESVANVPPESVANVPPESVANVPPESVANVPPESVANIPPESVANVPPESVANVPPKPAANEPPESAPNEPPKSAANEPPESAPNEPPKSAANEPPESAANEPPKSAANEPPESAANEPPESAANEPPESAANEPPESAANEPPESAANEPPESAANEPPESAPNESPKSAANEPPESAPNESPKSAANEPPDSAANESPKSAANEPPESAPNELPDSAPNESPKSAANEPPESAANEPPESAPNELPDLAPNKRPKSTAKEPPESTAKEPIELVPEDTTVAPILTKTTVTQRMDIDAIMAIISNLTYDYEWNLTEQFNKSIIQHGVPTCPWKGGSLWGPGGAWTAVENASTQFPWDFENSSVVSKCFVCGLKTPEIPRNAYCADAFAGDFLPLMPIDARSRSMIANYRKYCRYIDVQNYVENPEEPRAIYGRFTGGCAVRWTDITGIYTQRTCRSRYRPLLGKHFASKRMAKLELSLVNVENGCIISPMATLLPVSRGISLYARFHACVCNSNWCNRATLKQTSFDSVLTILVAHWLSHFS